MITDKLVMIEKENLLEHFDGDMELIQELTQIFEESYPEVLRNLNEAIKSENFSDVELHAHTLKGMISNFFAEEAKDIAFELEKMGRDKSITNATALAADLEQKVSSLLVELKKIIG